MKKSFLVLFFSLLAFPFVAGAAITYRGDVNSPSGGGTAGNGVTLGNITVADHTNITTGFDDVWDFSGLPSLSEFYIESVGNTISDTQLTYCVGDAVACDDVNNFVVFDSGNSDLVQMTATTLTQLVRVSAFSLRIRGNVHTADATYNMSVTNVPVPGAVWLFGSALLGLVSYTRRR